MNRRHRNSASTVLTSAGFRVVRYEPTVEKQKNSTGRTTYRKDGTCVMAVVNHQLPNHVFVFNETDAEQRKLWNFGRMGEVTLFLRLLERTQNYAPRVKTYQHSLDRADDTTYEELSHDDFENVRAYIVQTNKAVSTAVQAVGLNAAAYNLEQISGRLYDSGLDKCMRCHDWTEERDLNVTWHCPSCAERNAKELAIQVHC